MHSWKIKLWPLSGALFWLGLFAIVLDMTTPASKIKKDNSSAD